MIFKRKTTKLLKFHTGTIGMKEHREFVENLDKDGGRIIVAYVLYHNYSSSHKPESINYVVEYKKPFIHLSHRSSQNR